MPAIPLERAMVVWTPNTAPWQGMGNAAPAGSIAVVEWPDDRHAYTRYPKSDCAGTREWLDGSTEYRLERLARVVGQLLEEEHLNPRHVSQALRAIDLPQSQFAAALAVERERRRAQAAAQEEDHEE